MNELGRYILSNLEASERAIRNQARFNQKVVIFAMATTAYAILQTKKLRDLETKIDKLHEKDTDVKVE